jgi:hypothetical protein
MLLLPLAFPWLARHALNDTATPWLNGQAQSCSVVWTYSAAFSFSQHPHNIITNLRTVGGADIALYVCVLGFSGREATGDAYIITNVCATRAGGERGAEGGMWVPRSSGHGS